MNKRDLKIFWKKYTPSSVKFFLSGIVSSFILHALIAFKHPLGKEWFNHLGEGNFYESIVFQLNRLFDPISSYSIGLIILIFWILIKTKNRLERVFLIWVWLLGFILWLKLLNYNPIPPVYLFSFDRSAFYQDSLTTITLSSLFNIVTIVLILILIFWMVTCFIEKFNDNPHLKYKGEKIIDLGPLQRRFKKFLERFSKAKKVSSNDTGLSDDPLKSIESINHIRTTAKGLALFSNFEQIINQIYSLISSDKLNLKESSQAICLDGLWGSGKTSLMNIVEEKVKKGITNQATPWVNFSPWSFNNGDELIRDFFKNINSVLQDNFGENLNTDLGIYAQIITPSTEFLGLPPSFGELIKRLPFFKNKDLKDIKESIKNKLKNLDRKIVIVIDDLDRLEYEEAILTLKLVKQNLDFPNLLFILPFDYKKVSDLIVNVRKNCEYYQYFLQKIINFRLQLTPYSYTELEGVFIASIQDGEGKTELENSYINGLKTIFEWYVMVKSKLWFVDLRGRDDQSKAQNQEFRPIFSFYQPVFKQLVGQYSYSAEYSNISGAITESIARHSTGDSPNLHDLIEYLYRPIQQIAIRPLRTSALEGEFRSILNDLGVNDQEKDELWTKINPLLNNMNEPNRLTDSEKNLNEIKTKYASFQTTDKNKFIRMEKVLGNIMNTISEFVQRYENRKNTDDINFIKNWLVKQITPRDVKQLAQKLLSLPKNDQQSDEVMRSEIEKLAKLQS